MAGCMEYVSALLQYSAELANSQMELQILVGEGYSTYLHFTFSVTLRPAMLQVRLLK